ncbi:MAG: hypothetical protein ABIN18_12770 [Pseudomonadota bacterium]
MILFGAARAAKHADVILSSDSGGAGIVTSAQVPGDSEPTPGVSKSGGATLPSVCGNSKNCRSISSRTAGRQTPDVAYYVKGRDKTI